MTCIFYMYKTDCYSSRSIQILFHVMLIVEYKFKNKNIFNKQTFFGGLKFSLGTKIIVVFSYQL